MQTFMVLILATVLVAPAAALADVKSDHNTKIDYNVKCAKCHRETKSLPVMAKSLGVDPGKLTLRTSTMNREEMMAIIAKGKDKMPGFEQELTKEQISDLADYVLFLKKRPRVRSGTPTRLY